MKYCKDCVYFRGENEYHHPRCLCPKNLSTPDLVTGNPSLVQGVRAVRANKELCGVDALWFIKKRSLKERIVRWLCGG